MRPDLEIISRWIRPDSSVLDLGCGDGALLQSLKDDQGIRGYGLEIDSENVTSCIKKGINVIQTDIEAGLSDFDANSFDYVIMTQTIQAINDPVKVIHEMLRVGREAIVTFPNFGYWQCRFDLVFKGRMPVNDALPNFWYNTPNIHLCTIADFERLAKKEGVKIMQRSVVDRKHKNNIRTKIWPNFFAEIALYRFCKAY
ncbi:MAG: methionine biosynthesis protein MetW [Gammaproteobacteria bacterium]|nr:MAG: methionine biosynthesis protein MetW [Gammaproteobacteria bacterium]